MAQNLIRHDFATRAELAVSLAAVVANRLENDLAKFRTSLLGVSGGTTPGSFFEALSHQAIDWERVVVAPVDDRFVPESSERSNARLIKSKLLQNRAASARFVRLVRDGKSLSYDANAANAEINRGPPPSAVILGMGNDGHTASFFPDADELEDLLDERGTRSVFAVHAASAGEPRLTMSLAVMTVSRFVALHIEGDEKAATLERALLPGSTLPIRRVIDAVPSIEIFWAP